MDRHELQAALTQVGLSEYEIQGVHELAWRPSEFLYLREEAGRWVVGICERDVYTPIRDFPGEDPACRFFYSVMVAKTPPPPPSPGELAGADTSGLIARMERWRQVAWAEYQRARRARRSEDDGPARP